MKAISPADVIVELEDVIAACSPERCARMLARTADLLVGGRDRLQEQHIGLLDDVLLRLTDRIAPSALVQLSTTLAELTVAPRETLRRLASHKDPAVSCPVLLKSASLLEPDLRAVAAACDEQQLLAIARRSKIGKAVTEILVQRGNDYVCLAVIRNPGAEFSDAAYSTLIAKAGLAKAGLDKAGLDKAEQLDEISKALAQRPGTPDMVVRQLLSTSPRQTTFPKSTAPSGLHVQGDASASTHQPVPTKRPEAADYASARPEIVALNRIGKLNDSTVNRFAIRGEIANLFTALSVLSGAPIEVVERVMTDDDCEGLVMACRASRLNWPTTLTILSNRSGARLSFAERGRAQQIFETLFLSNSQWTVRWGGIAASASTGGPGNPRPKNGS
jgi:hypothetical protein